MPERTESEQPEVEYLDLGPADRAARATRAARANRSREEPSARTRRLLILLAACVAALVVCALLLSGNNQPARSILAGSPTPGRTVPNPATAAGSGTSTPAVVVIHAGHPFLNGSTGWELFGRGPGVLVRIQPDIGRITRTPIPALASSGPVSFLAGPGNVIIRPIDLVPGYRVRDGRPAEPLAGILALGGPVYPSQDPSHVWVDANDASFPAMVLTDLAGRPGSSLISLPRNAGALLAVPDGAGELLFPERNGIFDISPAGIRRVAGANATLLAVGPTGWLVAECDQVPHCATVLIARIGGAERTVSAALNPDAPRGWISPDGRSAAVFELAANGTSALQLLDLGTGALRPVRIAVDQSAAGQSVVWSPDGRWLFVIDGDHQLAVVDALNGGAVSRLGVALPPLDQLAVRID